MILIALIHDFSCPIGDPLRVEEKFSYLILEVLSMKSYHRDSWLASYHCEAVFNKRWIVHPLIYALELSHPTIAFSTYAFEPTLPYPTLSNGSVSFFYFFLHTRACGGGGGAVRSAKSRFDATLATLANLADQAKKKKQDWLCGMNRTRRNER